MRTRMLAPDGTLGYAVCVLLLQLSANAHYIHWRSSERSHLYGETRLEGSSYFLVVVQKPSASIGSRGLHHQQSTQSNRPTRFRWRRIQSCWKRDGSL